MRHVPNPFRRYAVFSGRASRREFWPFATLVAIGLVVTGITVPPIAAILALVMATPMAGVTVRRLHDGDRSAKWLIPLIVIPALMTVVLGIGLSILGVIVIGVSGIETSPGGYEEGVRTILTTLAWMLAGWTILVLAMLVRKGSAGANRYGDGSSTS